METISLLLVAAMASRVAGLGTASTIAISFRSKSVCGILARGTNNVSQTIIQCYGIGGHNRLGKVFSIQTEMSSSSSSSCATLSGGGDFFCGLSSNGSSLRCWAIALDEYHQSFRVSSTITLYRNATAPLGDLAVGDSQVCALQAETGRPLCWERRRRRRRRSSSLTISRSWFRRMTGKKPTPALLAITSGQGFSCGIMKGQRRVLCWGDNGIIGSQFADLSMVSLVAGVSHVCGLTVSGVLICKGDNDSGQADAPPSNMAFQYSSIALGAKHSCAIRRENGTVVCWGSGQASLSSSSGFSIQGISFESIVAGWDFTCGLTRKNLTIICWGSGWPQDSSSLIKNLPFLSPMAMVIPSPCAQDSRGGGGGGGVYPHSESEATIPASNNTITICKSCAPQPIPPAQSKIPITAVSSPHDPREEYRPGPYWAYEIYGSVGTILGIWALVYCLMTTTRRSHSTRAQEDSPGPTEENRNGASTVLVLSHTTTSHDLDRATLFSLAELAAATNNFSSEGKIGSGSFGKVYRGQLADGRLVAVKREEVLLARRKNSAHSCETAAFDSELALLSRVHHKHLVGLVGFCQEQDERLLVYNYMSKGSLHDHLHNNNNNMEKSSIILNSWRMRIKIALDAARGIEYLHNYAVPPIIHRDVKSSNILLDSNWTASVSDLGLSLLMRPESNEEHVEANAVVGTVGYIDPEYYVLKKLTTKSDVYGFGVVLLEILTGKRAVLKDYDDQTNCTPTGVVEYAGPCILAGEAWKVLDKRVGKPTQHECEAMELVAYTALRCVSLEGKFRPSMSQVVATLERAFSICNNDDDDDDAN
ncbi:hypothetical protein Dimus_009240 [Dionaea muscipula]